MKPGVGDVDRHIGARLKLRRQQRGLTQRDVGRAAGVSCQQVQKYEAGANRISASMLWHLANALNTPVTYFYRDLGDDSHFAKAALEAKDISRRELNFLSNFRAMPETYQDSVRSLVKLLRST